MVYPLESQITWHSGLDELTPYTFGPARITHTFCPDCGTSIGGKSNEQTFAKHRALNVSFYTVTSMTHARVTRAFRVAETPHASSRWVTYYRTIHDMTDHALQIRTLRGVDMDNIKIRKADTRDTKVTDEFS